MSGINRLLSRRDKTATGSHQKKVTSPPLPAPLPTLNSSASTSSTSTGVAQYLSPLYRRTSSAFSSLSSLSIAFPFQTLKRSPSLEPTQGIIHSSTANTSEHLLLQPKQTAGKLHGLFPEDQKKLPEKNEEEKLKELTRRLARAGITNFKEPDIKHALHAAYANGDPEKAFDVLVLLEESEEGIIKEYNPNVRLLGAVNRKGVTCWLDAVLFAMFARLGSFEAILYNTFEDEPRKRLAMLLRLWVNTLRVGKLITIDITEKLQLQLAECGWEEASELCQQDASEAFSFITEKLALPLLTLKMDIFHTGKEDASDDHKFVNERLLEVAIPEDSGDGQIITLEDCLETYFNNRIDVKRYLERQGTLNSMRSRGSIDSTKAQAFHIDTVELDSSQPSTPLSAHQQNTPFAPLRPNKPRPRAPSIIKEYYVSEKAEFSSSLPSYEENGSQMGRRRNGSLMKKEVMMPAWQFFSLIPWYTDNKPSNDAQVAAHFSSTRPVLGLCLKRYSMLPNGRAVRRNTHVDIPLEIGLPHFIQDDAMSEDGPIFGNFKLSLQSVVCHRGNSVDSGHYISLVRGEAPNASPGRERDWVENPTSDTSSNDRWMRFDDLARERVAYINIEKALRDETPYLVFYQVQPIEGDPGNVAAGEQPPLYSEKDSGVGGSSGKDDTSRGSLEGSEAARVSFEGSVSDRLRGRSSTRSERRASIVFTDVSTGSTKVEQESEVGTTEAGSLAVSRPGSKVGRRGSKSRNSSLSIEKRLSIPFSRMASRLTKDKSDSAVVTTEPVKDRGQKLTESPWAENTRMINSQSPQTDKTTAPDRAKLKKENTDKKARHSGHHLLVKGKAKAEKPDRECSVM